jgi:hypothetical protein
VRYDPHLMTSSWPKLVVPALAVATAAGCERGRQAPSPGAPLRGVDLYKPFASVLELPNLIASGQGDDGMWDAVADRVDQRASAARGI